MEASVSMEMEVSPLPLREEVPPREASVAADRPGRLRDPCDVAKSKWDFSQNKKINLYTMSKLHIIYSN